MSIVVTECGSNNAEQCACKTLNWVNWANDLDELWNVRNRTMFLPSNEPIIDQYFAEFVWIFSFSCDVLTAACKCMNKSRSVLSSKANSSFFCFSWCRICIRSMKRVSCIVHDDNEITMNPELNVSHLKFLANDFQILWIPFLTISQIGIAHLESVSDISQVLGCLATQLLRFIQFILQSFHMLVSIAYLIRVRKFIIPSGKSIPIMLNQGSSIGQQFLRHGRHQFVSILDKWLYLWYRRSNGHGGCTVLSSIVIGAVTVAAKHCDWVWPVLVRCTQYRWIA